MSMVMPYVIFGNGQCEEALNFYENVFDGKNKTMMRYGEYKPETTLSLPSDLSHYILHAEMEIYDTKIKFSDEVAMPVVEGNMIALTAMPKSVEEGKKVYSRLIENGEILLEPTETFYSPMHATVKDKFGILWHVIVL